jgi:hypothetical protein
MTDLEWLIKNCDYLKFVLRFRDPSLVNMRTKIHFKYSWINMEYIVKFFKQDTFTETKNDTGKAIPLQA